MEQQQERPQHLTLTECPCVHWNVPALEGGYYCNPSFTGEERSSCARAVEPDPNPGSRAPHTELPSTIDSSGGICWAHRYAPGPILSTMCISSDSFNRLKYHNVHQHIKGSEMSSNQQTCLSLSSVSHIYLTTEFFCLSWRGRRAEGKISASVHFGKLWTTESFYSHFASLQTQVWDTIYFQNKAGTPWESGFVLQLPTPGDLVRAPSCWPQGHKYLLLSTV